VFPAFFNHTAVNTNFNCIEIGTEFGTEIGAEYIDDTLCLALFSSQLGFWSEIGSVFAIIIVTIILASIALILVVLNKGSVGNVTLDLFPKGVGLDMDKVKVVFILIGGLAILSTVTIAVFATLCRATV